MPSPFHQVLPAVALFITATLVVACGGDTRSGEDVSLRTQIDTIGDTVVVRTLAPADAGVRQLVEEVRIGELDGADEYTFGYIGEMVALPNGNVIVFDQQAVALREYGGDGRLVRTFGRRGSGPGEYEQAGGLTLLADGRVALWDPQNGRIQLWAADGTPGESVRVPSGFYSIRSLWTDSEGRLYYKALLRDEADGEQRRFTGLRTGVARLALGSTTHDTLPPPVEQPEGRVLVASSPDGRMRGARSVPFLGDPSWTVHQGGGFAFTIDDRYRVIVQRPTGPLVIERDVAAVPVQAAERQNHEEVTTAGMRNIDPRWSWSGPSIPETKQYVNALASDAEGRLWVQTSMPGAVDSTLLADVRADADGPSLVWTEPAAFDVFGTDGRFLGRVVLPDRVSAFPFSAAGDRIWAVQRDELGVQNLVRWRVSPSLEQAPDA